MGIRVCYLACHEAGLCCYLVIHIENYYVRYSCFTSICDLFTVSPSYLHRTCLLVVCRVHARYELLNKTVKKCEAIFIAIRR
jgi:hypothetical protein